MCPDCNDTRLVERRYAVFTRLVPCRCVTAPDPLAELRAEVERLRRLNESLIEARAAAAEVLSRIANKERLTCKGCGLEWTL